MGILHRLFAARAPRVWELETRLLHRLGLVRPPTAVQWLATSACDLACPHCYTQAGKKSQGELDEGEVKRLIIDQLIVLEQPTFVIAGGEALLRRDLPGIVAHAAARGVPWALHTHGGPVIKHEQLFRRHPPCMVAVSLDGPREHHDRFRGKAGSFDRALEAVRVLKRAGVREVVLGTTVTRGNADLLADLFPIVAASGADSWGLHLVAPEGRGGAHAELLPTPGQLRRAAAFARRKRAVFHVEMDNEWGSAGADDIFYRDHPFQCGAGRTSMVVTPTGEVMPCTTVDPRESQGNVRDEPLSRIWVTRFARFRRSGQGVASDSKDCWLQTRNGRWCRGAAFYSEVAP
jgi:radical SAM protein with 4Fe4S-binding SPASM domain